MDLTSSASFRDPENAAFRHDGSWYRIAAPSSAQALVKLRSSDVYSSLVSAGSLVAFDEVDEAEGIVQAYAAVSGRPAPEGARVFRVESVELITYPWEWPNSLLECAALLTLDIRTQLLSIGLDLKDASAFNVQYRGLNPVFIDIGSIEAWRPNPSWNASRQFIEHFINPLAIGCGDRVTAADAWELGRHRGVRSEAARQLLPPHVRRSMSLRLLQATTRPVEGKAPSESRFAAEAKANPQLARNATLSLTRRLAKQVRKLQGREHGTTWVDYGTREHYGSDDLERKSSLATAFILAESGRERLVIDVGGNDGFTGTHLIRHANARVVVMDADAGALDVLYKGALSATDVRDRITPILGDITNLSPGSGLLDREFASFVGRIRPTAVLCQAVLHHVVITQGTPMQFAVDALAAFGAPVQIEFATPDDEKVRLLIGQIPNWSGNYSADALVAALQQRYRDVEVVGSTSPTRVVVNAWNPV